MYIIYQVCTIWHLPATFELDNNLQMWSERLGGIYHVSDITIYLEASEKVFLNLYNKQQLYHFVKAWIDAARKLSNVFFFFFSSGGPLPPLPPSVYLIDFAPITNWRL